MALVYAHKRLDKNEYFYIGIGKNINRAFSKQNRNNYWKNIISKVNYSIEILHNSLSWEEACQIEIFLISLYGRKDLKKGTLVNLTDGGEGIKNLSKTSKEKISKSLLNNKHFLNKKHSEEVKQNLSIFHTGKILSNETKNKISFSKKGFCVRNKKVINTITFEIYDSAKILANKINMNYITLTRHLNGAVKNKTVYKYL